MNPITNETMTNSQNTLKRFGTIVCRKCFACDYQSDILDFLLWTKLRLISWPVWKILLHASKSSFSATPIVLTIRTTLLSSHREIVTQPHYDAHDGQFAKFCLTPLNHRFYSFIKCLSSERHFGAVGVKFSLYRITAQKVTTLQNTVRRLIIIVLSLSYDAYNQSVTFKLLQ